MSCERTARRARRASPRSFSRPFPLLAGFVAAALLVAALPARADDGGDKRELGRFNQPGNVLISDQFNNRVIEVDWRGNVAWQFGLGPADFSPASAVGVKDAQRVGPYTLMAATGTPPATVPTCTAVAGCPDSRVLRVDRKGDIV